MHAVGLAEVARIEARFNSDVLERLGFVGTFGEFAAKAQGDGR